MRDVELGAGSSDDEMSLRRAIVGVTIAAGEILLTTIALAKEQERTMKGQMSSSLKLSSFREIHILVDREFHQSLQRKCRPSQQNLTRSEMRFRLQLGALAICWRWTTSPRTDDVRGRRPAPRILRLME